MKQSVINKIDKSAYVKGLFVLSDIRYRDNEDLLRIYEDEEDVGYKIFRINAYNTFLL